MRIRTYTLIGAVVAVGLSASVALANHNEPVIAKSQSGEFITAYVPCSAATANGTTSNGFPACDPAVRANPSCGFGPKGKGTYVAAVLARTGDIQFQALLVGLEAGCVGKSLVLAATVDATTDDCGGNACTVISLTDFPLGACTVDASGKCAVAKTTVNTNLPGTILGGKKLGIAIKGVDFFDGGTVTFQGGVLVP